MPVERHAELTECSRAGEPATSAGGQ